MPKLAKVLKTEAMGDVTALAQILQSMGRGKDTILAHITPAEAKKLKKAGGRGSKNPSTGLMEFADEPLQEVTVTATPNQPEPSYSDWVSFAPAGSEGFQGGAYQPEYGTDISYAPGLTTAPAAGGGAAAGYGGPEIQPALASGLPTDFTTPEPIGVDMEAQAPDFAVSRGYRDPLYRRALQGLGKYGQLGVMGLGSLGGLVQGRQGAKQIAALQRQQQAMAQPYQEEGRRMTQAAAAGQMTPASMQAYQAARAQMQQAAASRGAVGSQQMATQLEAFRQQLLQQQYTYGLQVAQIGDNIAMGAIRTGMQLDQQLRALTQNFYANMMSVAAKFAGQGG